MIFPDDERNEEHPDFERLKKIKLAHRERLLNIPHVHGVGIGFRLIDGSYSDELVIKVFVSHEIPEETAEEAYRIPSSLSVGKETAEVEIEIVGPPTVQVFRLRSRPLRGGSSIAPLDTSGQDVGVGTLGVCIMMRDQMPYILSCRHVLMPPGVQIGARVTQPALTDGGAPQFADVVANVSQAAPVNFTGWNRVDAALAQVIDGFDVGDRLVHWIGYPSFRPLKKTSGFNSIMKPVAKMGRTTEFTVGMVISVSADFEVDWSHVFGNAPRTNLVRFEDQLMIVPPMFSTPGSATIPFSQQGDSGSLVVDLASKRPVGMVMASGSIKRPVNIHSYTLANKIEDIYDSFGIEF
ncbi:MAG: hypothetical protein QNJ44_22305 [Rhodobacter sp.]|nr:hypothetical protein [Rhodobacter sp.]